MFEELDDEQIIARVQALMLEGKQNSSAGQSLFKVITTRYYQQAYNFCRYYNLRHHDAKDAMQEAFIRLFRYAASFDTSKKFKPWFFKLLFRRIQEKHVELKNKRNQDIDDFIEVISEKKNFSEEFQNREYWTGIINELPEKLKRVVVLYIFNNLGYEEIAEATGISSRQVRNQLDAAFEQLRERAGGNNEKET